MAEREQYTFADLNGNPSLVHEIVRLEERLREQTGQQVTLIAYTPADGDSETCRAGLNE